MIGRRRRIIGILAAMAPAAGRRGRVAGRRSGPDAETGRGRHRRRDRAAGRIGIPGASRTRTREAAGHGRDRLVRRVATALARRAQARRRRPGPEAREGRRSPGDPHDRPSARRVTETVRDYTCTFSKRERIDGRLTTPHVMVDEGSDRAAEHLSQVPTAGRGPRGDLRRRSHAGKVLAHDVGLGQAARRDAPPRADRSPGHGGLSPPDHRGRHRAPARHRWARWTAELDPSESLVTFRDGPARRRTPLPVDRDHP